MGWPCHHLKAILVVGPLTSRALTAKYAKQCQEVHPLRSFAILAVPQVFGFEGERETGQAGTTDWSALEPGEVDCFLVGRILNGKLDSRHRRARNTVDISYGKRCRPSRNSARETMEKTVPGLFHLGSQKARFSSSSIFNRLQRSKMLGHPWPTRKAL